MYARQIMEIGKFLSFQYTNHDTLGLNWIVLARPACEIFSISA